MPKKNYIDWDKYQDAVIWQQEMQDFVNKLQNMTGRDLYEMNSKSLVAKYIVDRPVDYALHGTEINYPVDPILVMRNCLIDGAVYLRVEGSKAIKIEDYVSKAEWNPISDELEFIERKWLYEDESDGQEYWHIEHYILLPDGEARFIEYMPVDDDSKPDTWVVDTSIIVPFFPYVGISWVAFQSFVETYKDNIIRQEAAFNVIASENIERMGLQLYIENIRNVDDIKYAPRRFGRRVHVLPKDATFHSPSSDPAGVQLMIEELDRLDRALERASGVVSTERLASLSGVSRMVAERPLIILATDIRKRFEKGMQSVVEKIRTIEPAPELEVSYKPLTIVEDTDKRLRLLDRAIEKNALTPEEEIKELRFLLDLSN